MAHTHIKVLGQFSVHHAGRPVTDLSAKAQELLCYLLLYRDRLHTREALAGTLWPALTDDRANKYLRQTLWRLLSALRCQPGDDPAAANSLITLNPGWLRINVAADWWLDVDVLEQAYAICHSLRDSALSDTQLRNIKAAVALYEDDLLATRNYEWCIYERERLQMAYLAIMDSLMDDCEARFDYAEGIAYGQHILRHDPARESTYQRLMRLHYRAGDRTTALREFERCAAALAREFDLPPAEETLLLRDLIRANRREDVTAAVASAEFAAPLLDDLRVQVVGLQTSLAEFQGQLRQDVASIAKLVQQHFLPLPSGNSS
jgi:DNA-binding SARP family transcriptional activator